ncbi:MAG: hypothetical protein ABR540_19010 [Acidimicrobiales bacterium]
MDPRASIVEARQLGIKPPARPVTTKATEPEQAEDVASKAPAALASRRRPRRDRQGPAQPAPGEGGEVGLPGFTRGNRRTLTVSLPRATLTKLRERSKGSTMGATVMEALRSSYEWLVETYEPEPAEAIGPFPAPVRLRRRRQVEDPAPVHLYVSPDEAAAVAKVADRCELSISELVTVGLEHHWSPETPSRRTVAPARRRKPTSQS